MQSLFNVVKGKALGVAEYLTPVLKESKFLETGVLTPEEFVAAGDHLTHHCPTWRWDAGDPTLTRPYLPADKQYLLTRNVPCYRRVKEMISEDVVVSDVIVDGDDGWVETHSRGDVGGSDMLDEEVQEMTLDDSKVKKVITPAVAAVAVSSPEGEDEDDEAFDMEEYERRCLEQEQEDPSEFVAEPEQACAADTSISSADAVANNILATRTYDLHITYDKYYQTPRLFLTGYDENREPLSVDAMYEDFSEDHANKTITMEQHPNLPGVLMASVHPCKHAETMKRIMETVSEGGTQLEVHLYLIVFLKFMQAIIPTVQYDFTQNFTL